MRVYISGPITGNPNYKEQFEEAENKIRQEGNIPINPAKLDEVMPADAGHNDYMTMCIPLLSLSDAICMLHGWRKSTGACIEYGYAQGAGKIVVEV